LQFGTSDSVVHGVWIGKDDILRNATNCAVLGSYCRSEKRRKNRGEPLHHHGNLVYFVWFLCRCPDTNDVYADTQTAVDPMISPFWAGKSPVVLVR
jgi:hypothetical protein